jgi:hypothetical protein
MTYRVVQWGTGAVGAWSLRQIIDHPDLELVGVWVSGESKNGKDAGELCGRPVTGVRATSSKEEIFALDADVVIHCALAVGPDGALPFDEDVARLLRSGKNVISTASYYSPLIEGPERMAVLQAACEEGSSTLYGGGVDPGFVCDRVAALLTGSVAEIKQIRMIESQDVSSHPGVALLSEVGFGKRPEERKLDSPGVQYYGGRLLPAAVAKLADLLGVQLEGLRHREDLVLATKDREVAMGTLKAGTIVGARAEFSGIRDGKPFITHQWVTYMGREGIPDDWLMAPLPWGSAPPYLVRIEIEGRPSLQNDMIYTDYGDVTSFSFPTAAVCINAIPDVCAAPPGFLQEQVFGRWRASMQTSKK